MSAYKAQYHEQAPHRVLWPDQGWVSSEQVLSWARDAEADGDIEGGFGTDAEEAKRQLDDAGLITFGRS